MEQMENIDFKAITTEVAANLNNTPLERRAGSWHRIEVIKIRFTPGMVRSMLVSAVWEKCSSLLGGNAGKDEPLAIEKAMASLMKRGVLREKIQFRKSSFRVRLENAEYRIYKLGDMGVYACPWPSEKKYKILASGEILADFLIRFDEELPAIVSHVPAILANIRARELEQTKDRMEKEIKDKLIRSLVDQYLKPLGLSVSYSVNAGNNVVINLKKLLSATITVPLDQLAGKLKDSAGILDSLEVVDPD